MKITYDEATYILKYKEKHFLEKYGCVWDLHFDNPGQALLTCNFRWLLYILLFLPVHFIKMACCLWDGGLREFEIEPRMVHYIHEHSRNTSMVQEETRFGRMQKVWENNNNL